MRRAGVGPWIASAAAAAFVLFGSGYQNIAWGFQIGFVGSLVFGLAHLLLADHDGPFDRRDALALTCGLAALMSSGVGVTMVVAVGLATVLRRGWRPAVLNTLPLAVVYVAWFLTFARDAYGQKSSSLVLVVRFVAAGIANGFLRLGLVTGGLQGDGQRLITDRVVAAMGLLLAVMLIIGVVIAGRHGIPAFRRRCAAPIAMVTGLVIFFLLTGFGRAETLGVRFASRSRYAHLTAALVLPALAIAADAIVKRWRVLAAPAIAVFLVGVPGSVGSFRTQENENARPGLISALAQVPVATSAPRSLQPMSGEIGASYVSMGWLRDGLSSGRIPRLDRISRRDAADATSLIALYIDRAGPPPGSCGPLRRPVARRLVPGGSLGFSGKVLVSARIPGGVFSSATLQRSGSPARIRTRYGPLLVRLSPSGGLGTRLCD